MTDDSARPEHMVRGERVYLRASERSDIPLFVPWLNDARLLAQSVLLMRVTTARGWCPR